MPTPNETKLGDREVGKSREYISNLAVTIPETFADYRAMLDSAEATDNERVKKLHNKSANALYIKFVEQRRELNTRLGEVIEKISNDAEKIQAVIDLLLPEFQTQQEMVEAKQAK